MSKSPVAKLGNRRVTGKEQFYTPQILAETLAKSLIEFVPDLAGRLILEPAGGTGSFIRASQALGVQNVVSFDIEPKFEGVKKADFLGVDLSGVAAHSAVAISNPPFGRNNSLSIPFFNHAASACDTIAFIVPRSWRKWSVINRLDRNFHLVSDVDVKVDYVDALGEPVGNKLRLNTCFQVWQYSATERRAKITVQDLGVVTKVSPVEAAVALTIFGFGCGRVLTEFERRPNTTRMFLRLGHPRALEALQAVDFGRFFRNTAYTEALALPEINFLLNEYIFGNPHLIEGS
jgi:predicted RNA methylase